MTTQEKQIRLDYGAIGFDTPDTSTFREIQKTFPLFFQSSRISPAQDLIKTILSSKV